MEIQHKMVSFVRGFLLNWKLGIGIIWVGWKYGGTFIMGMLFIGLLALRFLWRKPEV